MVSLQAAFSPEEKKTCPGRLENFLPKKRKCRDGEENVECLFAKEMKLEKEEDIELNIDAPLPLDWQRCLDIKSGEIHFYNTRMHRRTSRDPRLSLEPLSLDLELNLACKPPSSHGADEGGGGGEKTKQHDHVCSKSTCNSMEDDSGERKSSSNLTWTMSRTASEDDADPEEMVATVCMRCHMLVMMSRATLSCPNCKFLHPPNHSSSTLMMMMMKKKPAVKLLCCKD